MKPHLAMRQIEKVWYSTLADTVFARFGTGFSADMYVDPVTTYLFQELCEPVGGYGNVSIPPVGPFANTSLPTNASTSSSPSTPTTFTGPAPRLSNPIIVWLFSMLLAASLSVAINSLS